MLDQTVLTSESAASLVVNFFTSRVELAVKKYWWRTLSLRSTWFLNAVQLHNTAFIFQEFKNGIWSCVVHCCQDRIKAMQHRTYIFVGGCACWCLHVFRFLCNSFRVSAVSWAGKVRVKMRLSLCRVKLRFCMLWGYETDRAVTHLPTAIKTDHNST